MSNAMLLPALGLATLALPAAPDVEALMAGPAHANLSYYEGTWDCTGTTTRPEPDASAPDQGRLVVQHKGRGIYQYVWESEDSATQEGRKVVSWAGFDP